MIFFVHQTCGIFVGKFHPFLLSLDVFLLFLLFLFCCCLKLLQYLPTRYPTPLPTLPPTFKPTAVPTLPPSHSPTTTPVPITFTARPTFPPTVPPTPFPSFLPTLSPTMSAMPTSLPTPRPTHVPTYAPTVICSNGTYFIHPGTCEPCGIGRFSSYAITFEKKEQAPPWPEECTLCPPGQYQIAEGTTSCNNCAPGKLSAADRASCTNCQVRARHGFGVLYDCLFCSFVILWCASPIARAAAMVMQKVHIYCLHLFPSFLFCPRNVRFLVRFLLFLPLIRRENTV